MPEFNFLPPQHMYPFTCKWEYHWGRLLLISYIQAHTDEAANLMCLLFFVGFQDSVSLCSFNCLNSLKPHYLKFLLNFNLLLKILILLFITFILSCSQDRSVCSPGYPGAYTIDQAGLEDPPACGSQCWDQRQHHYLIFLTIFEYEKKNAITSQKLTGIASCNGRSHLW